MTANGLAVPEVHQHHVAAVRPRRLLVRSCCCRSTCSTTSIAMFWPPSLQRSRNESPHGDPYANTKIGWLFTAFLVFLMALLPIFGWLGNRVSALVVGRRGRDSLELCQPAPWDFPAARRGAGLLCRR